MSITMSSYCSSKYKDIHYRLYVCMLYFTLNKMRLKAKLYLNIPNKNKKIYEYEVEKYDGMEKLLLHCSALCDDQYNYSYQSFRIYYSDIETILNTFFGESHTQNYQLYKYPKFFIDARDKINKTNFSYNMIKSFKYQLIAGNETKYKINKLMLNRLANIDYKYLFDIINMFQTRAKSGKYNIFYIKTPNKVDAHNIQYLLNKILIHFFDYYLLTMCTKCCMYCKDIHAQILNIKKDIKKYEIPKETVKELNAKLKIYMNMLDNHTHFIFFAKPTNKVHNFDLYEKIINYSFTGCFDGSPTIIDNIVFNYHEYNMEQLFL